MTLNTFIASLGDMDTFREQQLLNEELAVEEGVLKYKEERRKAERHGTTEELPPEQFIINKAMYSMERGLQDFYLKLKAERGASAVGRWFNEAAMLAKLIPEIELGYLVSRYIISHLEKPTNLTRICIELANEVAKYARWVEFQKQHKHLVKKLTTTCVCPQLLTKPVRSLSL